MVGEGLLSAARFALRVVACGNALSLALKSNLGRSFSSFPAWAEYLITDSFESSGTFESDGGGGRIRTFEGLRRQIYSLIPLATWVPHPIVSRAGAARATCDLAELTARIELATC